MALDIFRRQIGYVGEGATIALQFEWRDLWLGLYVKPSWIEGGYRGYCVHVCLVPMLPLEITWYRIIPEAWGEVSWKTRHR